MASDELKQFLGTLYAYDQAGGYVPLGLAEDDFKKLGNYIAKREKLARKSELQMLIVAAEENLKDKALVETVTDILEARINNLSLTLEDGLTIRERMEKFENKQLNSENEVKQEKADA